MSIAALVPTSGVPSAFRMTNNGAFWSASWAVPVWATAPRFETVLGRIGAHDEIDSQIEAWTRQLKNTEVENRLKLVGISAERMRRIKDIIDSPDSGQRFSYRWQIPIGDPLWLRRSLSRSAEVILAPLWPAPSLGEHTREVLDDWLGVTDSEFADLEKQGMLE